MGNNRCSIWHFARLHTIPGGLEPIDFDLPGECTLHSEVPYDQPFPNALANFCPSVSSNQTAHVEVCLIEEFFMVSSCKIGKTLLFPVHSGELLGHSTLATLVCLHTLLFSFSFEFSCDCTLIQVTKPMLNELPF